MLPLNENECNKVKINVCTKDDFFQFEGDQLLPKKFSEIQDTYISLNSVRFGHVTVIYVFRNLYFCFYPVNCVLTEPSSRLSNSFWSMRARHGWSVKLNKLFHNFVIKAFQLRPP